MLNLELNYLWKKSVVAQVGVAAIISRKGIYTYIFFFTQESFNVLINSKKLPNLFRIKKFRINQCCVLFKLPSFLSLNWYETSMDYLKIKLFSIYSHRKNTFVDYEKVTQSVEL